MQVSPLVFEPILKSKVWGSRKLTALGKKLPADDLVGESWECADLPNAQSVVARGPQRGRTLHELIEGWGPALHGQTPLELGRFPLLLKFLDVKGPLSVQVHPDPAACADLNLTKPPKNEAWYIIESAAEAIIYRGLKPGYSKSDVAERLRRDPASVLEILQQFHPQHGTAYYLPAGTIHAASGDILIAEVQTPCDVTYRLYDWDRKRPAGDAGMHIDEGLECIREQLDFSQFEKRSHVTSIFTTVTRLVNCPYFRIEKVRFVEGVEQDIPYAEMVCWMVLEGSGQIHYDKGKSESFRKGDVVILPAALKNGRLKTLGNCTWLEITVPIESDLSGFPHPSVGELSQEPASKLISLGGDLLHKPRP